jgi:hypothetical protein
VFALASPEPAVLFKDRPQEKDHFDGFIAFDIQFGIAGLSDKTFKQIQDVDIEPYKTLLKRSLAPSPHDTFELKGVPHISKKVRGLRGARRRKMAPLTFSRYGYHHIHRAKDLDKLGGGPKGQPGHGVAIQ